MTNTSKAARLIGIESGRASNQLDRHLPVQRRLVGPVDLAVRAVTDQFAEFERPPGCGPLTEAPVSSRDIGDEPERVKGGVNALTEGVKRCAVENRGGDSN
jgi:hypothetical protein